MTKAIIADTEYTTWPGALESDWVEPWQEKEIFQLAAIKVDLDGFIETDSFDRLIIPRLNPQLSDLAVSLTSIPQERLDNEGVSFAQGLKEFFDFTEGGALPVICMNGDAAVFRRNCEINNIAFPFAQNFHRLRPFLESQGIDVAKNSSGTLHLLTDQPLAGHTHYALHDDRSMRSFLAYAQKMGWFTDLSQLPNDLPGRDPRAEPAPAGGSMKPQIL